MTQTSITHERICKVRMRDPLERSRNFSITSIGIENKRNSYKIIYHESTKERPKLSQFHTKTSFFFLWRFWKVLVPSKQSVQLKPWITLILMIFPPHKKLVTMIFHQKTLKNTWAYKKKQPTKNAKLQKGANQANLRPSEWSQGTCSLSLFILIGKTLGDSEDL